MATKRKSGKKTKPARAKSTVKAKTKAKAKAKAKTKAKKITRRPTGSRKRRLRPGVGESDVITPLRRLRTPAAGQSGDNQGLSELEDAGPESVEELVEEGQAFEAEAISGVENARRPDKSGIKTREVLEDDVPTEYDDTQ
jgi:N utilization substance protein A